MPLDNSKLSKIILSSSEFGPISFSPTQNPKPKGSYPLFDGPYAHAIQAQGDFGTLRFLELSNSGCTLCHAKFEIARDIHLQLAVDSPSLGVYFSMRSDFDCDIEGIGSLALHDHEYSLLFLPRTNLGCYLKHGREYVCFSVHFDLEYLDSIKPVIPITSTISDLIYRIERQEPTMIRESYMKADSEIKSVIQNLLRCPYADVMKEMYVEAKIHELLLLALSKAPDEGTDQRKSLINDSDIEKIRTVKEHIISHLDNPGSLKEIARLIGINEFKLKLGFRQVFNTTVFGMLFEERMQQATQLLSETQMSIEEIAIRTGYKSHSNFTAAFKKKFGYPPNAQRKINKA